MWKIKKKETESEPTSPFLTCVTGSKVWKGCYITINPVGNCSKGWRVSECEFEVAQIEFTSIEVSGFRAQGSPVDKECLMQLRDEPAGGVIGLEQVDLRKVAQERYRASSRKILKNVSSRASHLSEVSYFLVLLGWFYYT